MFISWRGYGLFAIFIPIVAALISRFINSIFGAGESNLTSEFYEFLMIILAFLTWFLGRYLNRNADDIGYTPHAFMGIPFQYFGFAVAAFVILQINY